MRPRIGEVPAVETAITTGERSTIDGIVKSHNSAMSTTLQGIRAALASKRTLRFCSTSSAAQYNSAQFSRSSARGSRGTLERCVLGVSSSNSSQNCSAKALTRAPARMASSALRAAATLPPSTATHLSVKLKKTGSWSITLSPTTQKLVPCAKGRGRSRVDLVQVALVHGASYLLACVSLR